MVNESFQPDPGGAPPRVSDPKAGEELTEGRGQPEGRPATGTGVSTPGGSKCYADTTETDTMGTGATGAGQPHSSGGGTSDDAPAPSGGEPPRPS